MKKWFVYDPNGDGYQEFEFKEQAETYAKGCISDYLDGEWDEDVEYVSMGRVTHTATQVNRIERPPDGELDSEWNDIEGNYWSENIDYRCNYSMEPIK